MVRVIDTFTGKEVRIGQPCRDGLGNAWKLLAVEDRILTVRGLIESLGPTNVGQQVWVPFAVKFLHPEHFLRRVAMVPT